MNININNTSNNMHSLQQESMADHKKKFHWTLKELSSPMYCEVCTKYIKTCVYSNRRGDEICCSLECLDNYGSILWDKYYSSTEEQNN